MGDALNDRQWAYLRALYECDQAKEAARRAAGARGQYDRTPASEWRWVLYGPTEPASRLYAALRTAGLVNKGTGATWAALRERGLVLLRDTPGALGSDLLEVQITPRGRKVMREVLGETAPKRPPPGQLRPRQWAALARLYAAGPAGELSSAMLYERGSFDWDATLLRLRDYRPQPLMEEVADAEVPLIARMRLTDAGRAYYEQHWSRYRALYPDVAAPEPPSAATDA